MKWNNIVTTTFFHANTVFVFFKIAEEYVHWWLNMLNDHFLKLRSKIDYISHNEVAALALFGWDRAFSLSKKSISKLKKWTASR